MSESPECTNAVPGSLAGFRRANSVFTHPRGGGLGNFPLLSAPPPHTHTQKYPLTPICKFGQGAGVCAAVKDWRWETTLLCGELCPWCCSILFSCLPNPLYCLLNVWKRIPLHFLAVTNGSCASCSQQQSMRTRWKMH